MYNNTQNRITGLDGSGLLDPYWYEFLWAMTMKEIKARYKNAVFGFLWIIINPLLQMLVIGFVFQFFLPVPIENYFIFLFTGLLVWIFVSLSITKATPAIVYERSLIQKSAFPRESIVLSIIFSNLFHLVVALLLLVVFLGFDQGITGAVELWRWLVVGGSLVWMTLVVSGISLFTSALNVRFRDVSFFVQAGMQIWFYGTPIIYTLDFLPEVVRPLFYLNPVTPVVEWMRWGLLGVTPVSFQLQAVGWWVGFGVMSLGIIVFYKLAPTFDDWL